MRGIIKLAVGVVALGFAGLVGLGVISIVAALIFGRSVSHQPSPRLDRPVSASTLQGGRVVTGIDVDGVVAQSLADANVSARVAESLAGAANSVAAASADVEAAREKVSRLNVALANPERPAHAGVQSLTPANVVDAWNTPARIQANYGAAPIHLAEEWQMLLAVMIFLAFIVFLFVALRFALRRNAPANGDGELVHELARRAQEMSQRMESLETILLDRTRSAFHNNKVEQQ